ncbi:MAG: ABC transporter ATP-binding protein [Deferrisomatales bacterium]
MNAYRAEGLRVVRGGREVVRVERLAVPAGGLLALVGPNGSGKTSLLEVLAFLRPRAGGRLWFFGQEVGPAAPAAREVGYLPQSPYLFDRPVAANVAWALRTQGLRGAALADRVAEALEQVGLTPLADRRATRLSGGEAQRLALARVLALEPRVLLLDEPLNHLDAASRDRIEEVVARWRRDRGTTVVLATHDVAQARRLGAEVWRVEGGQARPGGPDNVFRGRPEGAGSDVFAAGPLRLVVEPLPAETRVVEVDPREIVLSREEVPTSCRNRMRGTVVRAEAANGEVWVTVDCGAPLVAVVTQASWRRLGLTVGEEAVASFKATAVRVC